MDDGDGPAAAQPPAPWLFRVELGQNGGEFAPATYAEALGWLQDEVRFWDFANKLPSHRHRNVVEQHLSQLNGVIDALNKVEQRQKGKDPSWERGVLKDAANNLRAIFLDKAVPHSASVQGRRIEQLKNESIEAALGYAYALINDEGTPFNASDMASFRGLFEGLAERYGWFRDASHIKLTEDALSDLQARFEHSLAKSSEALARSAAEASALKKDLDAAAERFAADAKSKISDLDRKHTELTDQHAAQFDGIREAYAEQMKLRAPVSYWERRYEQHARASRYWQAGMFVWLAMLAIALWFVASHVFPAGSPSGLQFGLPGSTGGDMKINPYGLAVLALSAFLGSWIARLIIRQYLHHAHLATDSSERVTMVQTFLALIEGGAAISDEDRRLVLVALFRPASDGLVKEESVPHPILEILTRSSK